MSEAETEQKIVAAGLNAPRLLPAAPWYQPVSEREGQRPKERAKRVTEGMLD